MWQFGNAAMRQCRKARHALRRAGSHSGVFPRRPATHGRASNIVELPHCHITALKK
jgi:hypothetical protein